MLIKTLLNRVHHFKGFKYEKVRMEDRMSDSVIVVPLTFRAGSKGICSQCGCKCCTYDHLNVRIFHFIPLWGFPVEIHYTPRRLDCPKCGILVERMPWATGKSSVSNVFKTFLSHWAKKLSWKDVAVSFRVSWYQVYESIKYAVEYGLKHRELDSITSIGIDEIQYHKGHTYLTLVYQINNGFKRLLWIGKKRKVKTLLGFFRWLGKERTKRLESICSDMWKPYLKVIKKKAPEALNILDRFHIMKMFNDAIDKTRREEVWQLKEKGYENVLHKGKWGLLKNPQNLTSIQATKMKELLQYNLKSIKAYLLREEFQKFWTYSSATWASKFLDSWTFVAARSKNKHVKKVVRTLRKHKEEILNWFRVKEHLSNGIVEGFNGKAKLTIRKSYGFRMYDTLETALYHALGNLPDPPMTHRFI